MVIKRIGFFPAGRITAASSRIRVYSLFPGLRSAGIEPTDQVTLKNLLKQDVIYVQKRVNKKILNYVRIAKLIGKIIIYDIDDLGPHKQYSISDGHFGSIVKMADAITTGSKAQKDYLETEYGLKDIQELPCSIDYFPEKPQRNKLREGKILRMAWFGGVQNFHSFENHIHSLLEIPRSQIVVITTAGFIAGLKEKYPLIEFKPWSLETFVAGLRSCDLSILTHEGEFHDEAKTNNKMTASVTWGVPALVSNTPDYYQTAVEAGVEVAVFRDSEELVQKIEFFRSEKNRQSYLDQAQDIIWERYNSVAISAKLLNICSSLELECFSKRIGKIIHSIGSVQSIQ